MESKPFFKFIIPSLGPSSSFTISASADFNSYHGVESAALKLARVFGIQENIRLHTRKNTASHLDLIIAPVHLHHLAPYETMRSSIQSQKRPVVIKSSAQLLVEQLVSKKVSRIFFFFSILYHDS